MFVIDKSCRVVGLGRRRQGTACKQILPIALFLHVFSSLQAYLP